MRKLAVVLLLLMAGTSVGLAQQPPTGQNAINRETPSIKLPPAARQAIYASVTNTGMRQTAPSTFHVAIGETVPISVELQPMPDTVTEFFPETKEYHYALLATRVLLVEARSRKIVEIITQ